MILNIINDNLIRLFKNKEKVEGSPEGECLIFYTNFIQNIYYSSHCLICSIHQDN